MEIDEDDEPAPLDPCTSHYLPCVQLFCNNWIPNLAASARLLCTNLPQEVTDDVLSVLFQEYVPFRPILIYRKLHVEYLGIKVSGPPMLHHRQHQMQQAKNSKWRK